LPVLFQQGYEEVDTQLYILEDLFFIHTDIANSYSHAQHFLKLELDHGLGLIYLGLKRFLVGNKSWELSCRGTKNIQISLGKAITEIQKEHVMAVL
jgi:hypothetical protein